VDDIDVRVRLCHGRLSALDDPSLPLHLFAEPNADWWHVGVRACLRTCAVALLDEGLVEGSDAATVEAFYGWAQGIYAAHVAKLQAYAAPLVVVAAANEHLSAVVEGVDLTFHDDHFVRKLDRLARMPGLGYSGSVCFRDCVAALDYAMARFVQPVEEKAPALARLVCGLRMRAPRVRKVEAALAALRACGFGDLGLPGCRKADTAPRYGECSPNGPRKAPSGVFAARLGPVAVFTDHLGRGILVSCVNLLRLPARR
jgi:hypothetical protein